MFEHCKNQCERTLLAERKIAKEKENERGRERGGRREERKRERVKEEGRREFLAESLNT